VISRLTKLSINEELEHAISKLANDKAPRESSVHAEVILGCYARVRAILLNSRIIEASVFKISALLVY
jgi:hypothetical protein